MLSLITFSVYGQGNLIPNPSFEDTLFCPYGTGQIHAATNWLNFGNSPDYFNSCNSNFLNVPSAAFGFQYAHSGKGMAGLATYDINSGPDYREFIGVPLLSSLVIGVKYYFSFFTNFAYSPSAAIASDKIGVRFANSFYTSSTPAPINNFAHTYSNYVLQDSILWVKISGSFIADSNYQYLMIGNFFNDNSTNIINLGPMPNHAYYYIDDVCVSTDSLYNELWTSIDNVEIINERDIEINPIPSSKVLNGRIKNYESPNAKLSIMSSTGVIISTKFLEINKNNSFKIDIFDLSPGVYYLIFNIGERVIAKKFIKT